MTPEQQEEPRPVADEFVRRVAEGLSGPHEGSLSFADRRALGRAARATTPRSSHAEWETPAGRRDPVDILLAQATTRVPELVPLRHARMMASPFAFYRGAAAIMAADLADTPVTGLTAQICGDAHLSNFGLFGTPEREMVFDINDFDETLPGPWEWDVKRLAASFEIAGRHRGFSARQRRASTIAVARGYRNRMRESAEDDVLASWYSHLTADQLIDWVRAQRHAGFARSVQVRQIERIVAKARTQNSAKVFKSLVDATDSGPRIRSDPPLIVPLEELVSDSEAAVINEWMLALLRDYRRSLRDVYSPLDDFRFEHIARKVVGVGSVGTRAWLVLLTGRDERDPLLLQAKEAEASVLEAHLPPSVYPTHGERVVRGQRAMQAASDIFLGWTRLVGIDGRDHDYYLRQFRDWKGSIDVEQLQVEGAMLYAQICGETLARAHARSGDRVAIAGYLGAGDTFDRAISEFARGYADQNESDYEAFAAAAASGRVELPADY